MPAPKLPKPGQGLWCVEDKDGKILGAGTIEMTGPYKGPITGDLLFLVQRLIMEVWEQACRKADR